MKHKKILAVAGALALTAALAGGALALSGGDSLVSLSYLKNTFLPSAQTQLEQTATQPLQEAYDEAVAKLQGGEGGSGLYSDNLSSRTFTQGDVIGLPTGSGFLSISGSAQVSHNGVVVDVTDGREVASGARLTVGHRYLVGENTTAQVTVTSGIMYLGLQGSYTFTDSTASHLPFVDVASNIWYYPYIQAAYAMELMNGMGNDRFTPNGTVQLSQTVAVAVRIYEKYWGIPDTSSEYARPWYTYYMDRAKEYGILPDSMAGSSPTGTVSRAEVAEILYRSLPSGELPNVNQIDSLPDYGPEDPYWSSVSALYRAGVLTGDDIYGTFRPNSNIRRSELAAILVRLVRPEYRIQPDSPDPIVPDTGMDAFQLPEELPEALSEELPGVLPGAWPFCAKASACAGSMARQIAAASTALSRRCFHRMC